MRFHRVASLLLALPALGALDAQAPRQLTAEDYARAERFLAPQANPSLIGSAGRPTWLPDGRFYYRSTTPNGSAFYLVNPARKTRAQAFDHARLAAALTSVAGSTVDGNRLP